MFADIVGPEDPGVDPDDVAAKITDRTKAVACVHFAGYPAAADALADLCADRGLALIEDSAHAPSATLGGRKLGTIGLAGAFSFFSNKILAIGEGGLLATDDDDVAALARSRRSHAMTSGTWDRHSGAPTPTTWSAWATTTASTSRASALALSRLERLEEDIADAPRAWCASTARGLGGLDGLIVPYRDQDVDDSSCYVMPVMLEDARPPRRLPHPPEREPRRRRPASSTRPSTSSRPTAAATRPRAWSAPSAPPGPRSRCRCTRT